MWLRAIKEKSKEFRRLLSVHFNFSAKQHNNKTTKTLHISSRWMKLISKPTTQQKPIDSKISMEMAVKSPWRSDSDDSSHFRILIYIQINFPRSPLSLPFLLCRDGAALHTALSNGGGTLCRLLSSLRPPSLSPFISSLSGWIFLLPSAHCFLLSMPHNNRLSRRRRHERLLWACARDNIENNKIWNERKKRQEGKEKLERRWTQNRSREWK